jgi:hypothetical protein
MDIYSFIHASKDVVDHCRKIAKKWNTFEMAIIIITGGTQGLYPTGKTSENQRVALQELIDSYPDMPMPIPPPFNAQTWEEIGGGMPKITYNNKLFEKTHEFIAEVIKTGNIEDHLSSYSYRLVPLPFERGDILIECENSCGCEVPGMNIVVYDGNGFFVKEEGLLCGDHIGEEHWYERFYGELKGDNKLLHYVSRFMKGEIEFNELLAAQYKHVENRLTSDKKKLAKTNPLTLWGYDYLSVKEAEFIISEIEHDSGCLDSIFVHGGDYWITAKYVKIIRVENHHEQTDSSKFNPERRAMAESFLNNRRVLTAEQVVFVLNECKCVNDEFEIIAQGGSSFAYELTMIIYDENFYEKKSDIRFNPERRAMAISVLEAYGSNLNGWRDPHAEWIEGKLNADQIDFLMSLYPECQCRTHMQEDLDDDKCCIWILCSCVDVETEECCYAETNNERFNPERYDMAKTILEIYGKTKINGSWGDSEWAANPFVLRW